MTAAVQRAAYAAIGRDIGARASSAERRAAGLAARGTPAPPTDFATLAAAPAWLRWSRGDLQRLAIAVALRSISSTLATSIDGNWLGAIATVADEDMLDWAIAGHVGEDPSAADVLPADALAPRGFAILKAGLAPNLRGYLGFDGATAQLAQPETVESALAYVGKPSQ